MLFFLSIFSTKNSSKSETAIRFFHKFAYKQLNEETMLPKFLLADNSQETPDTIFVVHTEEPKFIVESDIEDFWSNQEIHWLSDVPESEELINQLLEEAEEYLEAEFESQENLFDEEEQD